MFDAVAEGGVFDAIQLKMAMSFRGLPSVLFLIAIGAQTTMNTHHNDVVLYVPIKRTINENVVVREMEFELSRSFWDIHDLNAEVLQGDIIK